MGHFLEDGTELGLRRKKRKYPKLSQPAERIHSSDSRASPFASGGDPYRQEDQGRRGRKDPVWARAVHRGTPGKLVEGNHHIAEDHSARIEEKPVQRAAQPMRTQLQNHKQRSKLHRQNPGQ